MIGGAPSGLERAWGGWREAAPGRDRVLVPRPRDYRSRGRVVTVDEMRLWILARFHGAQGRAPSPIYNPLTPSVISSNNAPTCNENAATAHTNNGNA